ncbi:MAG: hypothetical protein ACTSR2_01690 [Candidatus Hodarchaeales archaeon]
MKRKPYQRLRIETVNQSELVKNEDGRWRVMTSNGTVLSRVWLMGVVSGTFSGENNYEGLMLEDGSGCIAIKSWDGSLKGFSKWDKLEILGNIKISEQDDTIESYIVPDIISKITDDNWFLYHRLKIAKRVKEPIMNMEKAKIRGIELGEGVVSFDDLKKRIREVVKELDDGNGVALEQIKEKLKGVEEAQIEEAISELRDDGEFFEPRSEVYSYIFD